MRGTVFSYRLKNGQKRWRAQVEIPGDKRERLDRAGFEKKGEAEIWLHEQISRLRATETPQSSDRTLADFIEWWIVNKIEPACSPKTTERYRTLARHVTSRIGQTKLYQLTAIALEEAYAAARKEHGLSAKTISHIHGCMHSALNVAVKRKLIVHNPSAGCDLPKIRKSKKGALEAEQVNEYMRAADATWLGPILRLAAATGARRGELLALRWSDIDWMAGTVKIERAIVQTRNLGITEKGTKEDDDRKPIKLGPSTLEVLRMHKQKQEQEAAMFGKDYKALGLVFARPDGDFMKPDYVGKVALKLGRDLGLPHVGLHAMRHSHGSLLIAAGTPVTVVAERLGHANSHTTLKIYAHALPSDSDKAADTWEGLMKK